MEVFVDMDGILTDYVTAICAAHSKPDPYLDPANYQKFDIEPIWGMSASEYWKPTKNMDFWLNMRKTSYCHDILNIVESRFGRENVTILTSPTASGYCSGGKHEWLINNLPEYKRKFLIGPPKEKIAGPGKLLVDDRDTNVEKFAEKGVGILFPRLWNKRYEIATKGDQACLDYFARELDMLLYV